MDNAEQCAQAIVRYLDRNVLRRPSFTLRSADLAKIIRDHMVVYDCDFCGLKYTTKQVCCQARQRYLEGR